MSDLSLIPLLLFAQARIEAMPSVVQTVEIAEGSSSVWILALAFAAIGIGVIASVVLKSSKRARNDNRHLFKELCHANQLSCGQCRALRKLSQRLRIANPSRLFLEVELWGMLPVGSKPVGSKPGQPNQPASAKTREEISMLREQLFTPGQASPQS